MRVCAGLNSGVAGSNPTIVPLFAGLPADFWGFLVNQGGSLLGIVTEPLHYPLLQLQSQFESPFLDFCIGSEPSQP